MQKSHFRETGGGFFIGGIKYQNAKTQDKTTKRGMYSFFLILVSVLPDQI